MCMYVCICAYVKRLHCHCIRNRVIQPQCKDLQSKLACLLKKKFIIGHWRSHFKFPKHLPDVLLLQTIFAKTFYCVRQQSQFLSSCRCCWVDLWLICAIWLLCSGKGWQSQERTPSRAAALDSGALISMLHSWKKQWLVLNDPKRRHMGPLS